MLSYETQAVFYQNKSIYVVPFIVRSLKLKQFKVKETKNNHVENRKASQHLRTNNWNESHKRMATGKRGRKLTDIFEKGGGVVKSSKFPTDKGSNISLYEGQNVMNIY